MTIGRGGKNVATHPYDQYRKQVRAVLESKLEEFRLLNYDHITEQELWDYLLAKKWRKGKETIHLYEIVNDIFSLKVSDFITYATVQHLQSPDFFSEEGLEGLNDLLGKNR